MKTNNPICPHDLLDCKEFTDLDGYLDCSNCPRYCNGVRATGGMPNLEKFINWIKSFKSDWELIESLKSTWELSFIKDEYQVYGYIYYSKKKNKYKIKIEGSRTNKSYNEMNYRCKNFVKNYKIKCNH